MFKIQPQLIHRVLQIYADVIAFKSTTVGELDFLRDQLSRLEPILSPDNPVLSPSVPTAVEAENEPKKPDVIPKK